jgi:hemerythrin-like domain-containing protein
MLQYLHDFPEKLHHPKEEQYIHTRLVQRHAESHAVIDELEQQHQAEYQTIARLDGAFADCTANKPGAVVLLVAEIDGYAQGIWKHMTLEERTLLPMAKQYLVGEDWREIAQAFENNNDPRFGDLTNEAFKRLFTRITHLLPEKTAGA